MRQPKADSPDREKKDVLDHIEEFIEKNLRKGLDEVEKFVKEELLKKNGHKEPGAVSYIEAFLKDRKVASLHPSTKFVIERVLKMVDWGSARVIVEYGPAKGVITKPLLAQLPPDGVLVAIETNDHFVDSLRRIEDPRLRVLHGSVLDIDELMAPLGVGPADAVVSGIPFSYLKPVDRHRLLHKTEARLGRRGRFIAYQFTTHLIPLMKYHFEDVDVQFEIRNLPPHFIFTGFKEAPQAPGEDR